MLQWVLLLLIASISGQSGSSERPAGWKVRLDRPGLLASEPYFATMAPGWHLTTSSPVIAYESGSMARGSYRLESEVMLFPGGPNEGYGLFVGGSALESNDLAYTAFQLRADGSFSIWQRTAGTTRDIVRWTPHPAVVPHKGGVDPIRNVLTIDVRPDEALFQVNGRTVHLARRSVLSVEGNFGCRVDGNLNVHITRLALQNSHH